MEAIGKRKKLGNRKYKKKKETPSQNEERKPKLIDFNILQANVCCLDKKKTQLAKMMADKNIHIALFQETLHSSCNIHITGYTPYPCSCQGCRGMITYVRNDIQGDVENLNWNPTDAQKATLWYGNNKLTIFNMYCPPSSTLNFLDQSTNFKKTVFSGDFNGHSPRWGYGDLDNTGRKIEEICESTNLILLQDAQSQKTLLHRRHGTLHRPDLTLVSADIENHSQEEVLECISSDHLPVLTKLNIIKRKQRKRKTRWNFKKAKWEDFGKQTDSSFDFDSYKDMEADQLNDHITLTALEASKIHIPRGCRDNYKPHWNPDLEQAVKVRHAARLRKEDNNTPENRTDYNRTTAKAKLITKQFKKESWTETCEALNLRQGGREAWQLLNNLSGENRKTNPQPLHLETESITSDFRKAEHFNKCFASVSKASKKTPLDKGLANTLREKEGIGTDNRLFLDRLTQAELDKACRKLKNRKSPGPDKIHNEMISHLGPKGKEALLYLFNKTWETGIIPKA